jgi:hypothetical protein
MRSRDKGYAAAIPTTTLSVAVPAAIRKELTNCRPALPLSAVPKLSNPNAAGSARRPVEAVSKALRKSQVNGLTQMTAMKVKAIAMSGDGRVPASIYFGSRSMRR